MSWGSTRTFRWRAVAPLCLCLLIGGSALLSACSLFSAGDPPLPDSTTARVLVELHLLEGQHRRGLVPDGRARDSIFAHYGTDRATFERTLDYYSAHPKSFATLYTGVVDTLRAIEKELEHRSAPSRRSWSDAAAPPPGRVRRRLRRPVCHVQ